MQAVRHIATALARPAGVERRGDVALAGCKGDFARKQQCAGLHGEAAIGEAIDPHPVVAAPPEMACGSGPSRFPGRRCSKIEAGIAVMARATRAVFAQEGAANKIELLRLKLARPSSRKAGDARQALVQWQAHSTAPLERERRVALIENGRGKGRNPASLIDCDRVVDFDPSDRIAGPDDAPGWLLDRYRYDPGIEGPVLPGAMSKNPGR